MGATRFQASLLGSPNTKLPIRLGVSRSPDCLHPLASTCIRIRRFLWSPGSCRASCPLPSLRDLPGSLHFGLSSLPWLLSLPCPTPVTVSTLVTVGQLSSARSVISLARDAPELSPLPFFLAYPNSSTNTAYQPFKRRKFCPDPRTYLSFCHYYVARTWHSLLCEMHLIHTLR